MYEEEDYTEGLVSSLSKATKTMSAACLFECGSAGVRRLYRRVSLLGCVLLLSIVSFDCSRSSSTVSFEWSRSSSTTTFDRLFRMYSYEDYTEGLVSSLPSNAGRRGDGAPLRPFGKRRRQRVVAS